MVGGLSGVGLSMGTMVANWVGFACGYAPYGSVQWRLPLALQIPWGIIMFISLTTFMPNSPRQLIQKGKVQEARQVFQRIWTDLDIDEVSEEFKLMQAQIQYEDARQIPNYWEIFKLYRHRVLVYGFCLHRNLECAYSLTYDLQVNICSSFDKCHWYQCCSGMSWFDPNLADLIT